MVIQQRCEAVIQRIPCWDLRTEWGESGMVFQKFLAIHTEMRLAFLQKYFLGWHNFRGVCICVRPHFAMLDV